MIHKSFDVEHFLELFPEYERGKLSEEPMWEGYVWEEEKIFAINTVFVGDISKEQFVEFVKRSPKPSISIKGNQVLVAKAFLPVLTEMLRDKFVQEE
jgi:hypothetical protein